MRKSRRQAREMALRALYEYEVGKVRIDQAVTDMKANATLPDDLMAFAEQLVRGVHANGAFLDDKLGARVQDWDFERIASVDRNLLRIAAFEMYYIDDVPPLVSIHEAIELAKKYSTAESGRFVHGVLGKLLPDTPKADWAAPPRADVEQKLPEEPEAEEETILKDSEEEKELSRVGQWKLRSEDPNG